MRTGFSLVTNLNRLVLDQDAFGKWGPGVGLELLTAPIAGSYILSWGGVPDARDWIAGTRCLIQVWEDWC
jgi:hypothetical protein